ncbi:hypothetical protein [Hymenobacter latericus]|uniref:hypothetical protein n=1 Tax=Hymenobacter sp. YIM 151858-1 TaxID=2987688 RepID=UPI00222685BE|nr:hypothetical protein [Hymenobacter sp. YIM 151858-1]UYZ60166.1 hypothetical protein OIS50_05025 [Hymenobacter sp. YIM 151858-1]
MKRTEEFSVSKSTVECYKIRHKSGFYWADITIDANPHGGRIQIASDYGTWQNYWGATGGDFKEFLAKLNHDYAASKFGVERWLDVKATVTMYKRRLFEWRRAKEITADKARDIYNELEEVRHENHKTFESAVLNTDNLYDFLTDIYDVPDVCYEPDPHFKKFWEETWPILLAEFKRELEPVTV